MKQILSLSFASLILLSCKEKKPSRPTADIPKGIVDTMSLTNNDTLYDIKKSPGEQHKFKVDASRGDTMIVENYSK